jgi:RecA-family ATPase
MPVENDEISAALSDEIASWRRVVNGAPPENALGVFRTAAAALWTACAIDKTMNPDLADTSFQIVVDELTEIGVGAGITVEDVQHIIISEKDKPQPYRNGNGHHEQEEQPKPALTWSNIRSWDDGDPPMRQWAIHNRTPLKQAGLFSGEGGTGKSIIELTKNVAHVMAKDWLGSMPQIGPTFYIGAEDDEDELRRRLTAIVRHYGVTFTELADAGMHVMSMIGKNASLVTCTRSGKVETTALYKQLYEMAGDIKPKNISIDTLSHAFSGNEIDRVQVYGFAIHMQALAIVAEGSVTILSHPSLAGVASGSGISGSTAWHSAFRFRHYLKGAKKSEEDELADVREIEFKKNQYGPLGETIALSYQSGLFLPVAGRSSRVATGDEADTIFLDILRRYIKQNRPVRDQKGTNYAPALFAKEDEAQRANIDNRAFEAAMRRLFKLGKIENVTTGPQSKRRTHIGVAGDLLDRGNVVKFERTGFDESATPFERPRSTSQFQVMGATLDSDTCEHCGKSGNVYQLRDPFRGVEAHNLHEECAPAFFQRRNHD